MTKNPHLAFRFLGILLCAVGLVLIACSNDEEDGKFFGTVRSLGTPVLETARDGIVVPNINVCALGQCSTTDANGNYIFFIDPKLFSGGPVLFTLNGLNVDGEVVVNGIVGNPSNVEINFFIADLQLIQAEVITNEAQSSDDDGGPSPQPTTIGTSGPGEEPTSFPIGTSTPDDDEPDFSPTSTPTVDDGDDDSSPSGCQILSGQYEGNGGCQIGVVNASSSGGKVTLTPFGENNSAEFNVERETGSSTSSNLTLFKKKGHSCTISCSDDGESFTVRCSSSAGSCSERFIF